MPVLFSGGGSVRVCDPTGSVRIKEKSPGRGGQGDSGWWVGGLDYLIVAIAALILAAIACPIGVI